MSSSIRQIPGFYYDESRKRYFKIINGAIPEPSSSSANASSKYHNNSIQSEQRYIKHTSATTNNNNNNNNCPSTSRPFKIIKNHSLSKIPLPQRSKYLQQLKPQPNPYTFHGLLHSKIHGVPNDNQLLESRITSKVITPKQVPILIPRGFILGNITAKKLVISRISTLPVAISKDFEYYPQHLTIQYLNDGINEEEDRVREVLTTWLFLKSSSDDIERYNDVSEFYKYLGVDDAKQTIYHSVTSDGGVMLVVTIHTYYKQNKRNFIVRMNTIDRNGDCQDVTYGLMKCLKYGIMRSVKDVKMKKKLFNVFGIDSCIFLDDDDEWCKNPTTDEMNHVLENLDKTKNRKRTQYLTNFLLQHDINNHKNQIIYRKEMYDADKHSSILDCKVVDNILYFVISNGYLISSKFTNDPTNPFTNFQIVNLQGTINKCQLLIESPTSDPYIQTRFKIIQVDKSKNVKKFTIPVNSNTKKNKVEYIRKIFQISSEEFILVLKHTIEYWKSGLEMIKITDYFDVNDVNQQFKQ
ncbi:hypothetical protein G210_3668, partial [Candida maltosa Xu316]